MNRLLILACSQRKNPALGMLPAIDRYDGPAFRVLRKFLREAPPDLPAVLILSAKYGLIDAATRIPDYDCCMSPGLAERLRPAVRKTLERILAYGGWWSVGFCAGRQYRVALDGVELLLPEGARLEVIGGGQGRRLTALRRWLRHEPPCGDGMAGR
jgi:hypothetical protein